MFGSFGTMELVVLLVVVLLLFGSRLPSAMGNLGKSWVSFKKGVKEEIEDDSDPRSPDAVEKQERSQS